MFLLIRGIINGIKYLFGGGRKRKLRLEAAGVDTQAEVIGIQDTGMTVNDNPRVMLTVRITPVDGSEPFEASQKRLVSRLAIPRAGDTVQVRYDPEDRTNIAIGAPGS
jgi:hypothetical protein